MAIVVQAMKPKKKEGSCTTVDGVERNCTYVTVCVSTIP